MLDEVEAGGIGVEGLEEVGVGGAVGGLLDDGKEKGNLELDLDGVNAVQNTIEFGISKGGAEFSEGGGFFGEEFLGVVGGFLVLLSVVSFETRGGTSERAREGIGDGAEIGGFE